MLRMLEGVVVTVNLALVLELHEAAVVTSLIAYSFQRHFGFVRYCFRFSFGFPFGFNFLPFSHTSCIVLSSLDFTRILFGAWISPN